MKTYHYSQLVNFPDIDISGALYHGRYLDYYDRARQTILKENGISFAQMFEDKVALIIGEFKLRFQKPIVFENEIHIYSKISKVGSKTIGIEQVMKTSHNPQDSYDSIVESGDWSNLAEFTVICVDLLKMKAVTLPDNIKAILTK